MPIIKDETSDKIRTIIFEISAIGSNPFVLLASNSINFPITISEAFSLQKPYRLIETRFEKRVNSLVLSEGLNTVDFSFNRIEDNDSISIDPDFNIPLEKRLWNKIKNFRVEPSLLTVTSRIRTARLSDIGIGANPTLSWNISFQVYFSFM